MVKRDELIKFIYQTIGKGLLEKAAKIDEVANGVQILGKEGVAKVALGVSLNEVFLKEAVKRDADFCIFHHGLDPRTVKSRFPICFQKRLRMIFQNNLTIVGLHYALDSHPLIGNNAMIIKKLGAKIAGSLYDEWGFAASFPVAQDVKRLRDKCAKLFNHSVLAVLAGPQKVKTIGVVSGAGVPQTSHFLEMEDRGVELFISGETHESVPYKMRESGINYFLCGHYNTEVFGVKALGEKIKAKFKNRLKVEFIDIPNEV
jgi:dinuclear metal center YbgI/SA1388 family protein